MQTTRTLLSALILMAAPVAGAQVALTPTQRNELAPCLTETDNLRRLLCLDLALEVSVETAWSELPKQAVTAPTTVETRALAFPHLTPVLNTLEAARAPGSRAWQFTLHAPRLNDATLPGVLYGPGDLFSQANSLFWPQPEALLQTGVEIFASQRVRGGADAGGADGTQGAQAYLIATCANDFAALTLALNTPVTADAYLMQEAYPNGQISQSVWRALDGGLVLEMARGLPRAKGHGIHADARVLTLSYEELDAKHS